MAWRPQGHRTGSGSDKTEGADYDSSLSLFGAFLGGTMKVEMHTPSPPSLRCALARETIDSRPLYAELGPARVYLVHADLHSGPDLSRPGVPPGCCRRPLRVPAEAGDPRGGSEGARRRGP